MTASETIYRLNYKQPAFYVKHVDLIFDLKPNNTTVTATTQFYKNDNSQEKDLLLYGRELELLHITLNNKLLAPTSYKLTSEGLLLIAPPKEFTLSVQTKINPAKNTSLMGLYVSNGNFFTQCEAEGFRKITYFLDRPDVMATYQTTIIADKQYPVLLSNGNLVEQGETPDNRHFAKWNDPFKKPSYLFALVAGNLVCQEENFKLADGRVALLQVWVEPGNLDKTDHAMQSLKNSITWDEQRFGLELDLDRFMIVAVADFNMGAMENKGLNIFNTRYVLANPKIATDVDYANIEGVVGHEYFHNWTGDRVTCRDWFQLSLKEGLTVFRDQEFSADLTLSQSGRATKRIEDVKTLRARQFLEDSGPMAHPVRPDSYQEINNFYTVTVYEKGAEVVRMYQTLFGRDGFRRGMDLYFKRHDGQAVTCRDFLDAMAAANNTNLDQFELWYSQAGTPRVAINTTYDEQKQTLELNVTQSCPDTPGQTNKKPFLIPLAIGLIDKKGQDITLCLDGQTLPEKTAILKITQEKQTFTFTNVPEKPVVSALRGFSAPVILTFDQTNDDLIHLLSFDSDHFNRWEASQRLFSRQLVSLTKAIQNKKPLSIPPQIINACDLVLKDNSLTPSLKALTLTLPDEVMIAERLEEIDPQAIHLARQFMLKTIATSLEKQWLKTYQDNLTPGQYNPNATDSGKRSLKNLALQYLLFNDKASYTQLAIDQFQQANNMTDRLAALTLVSHQYKIDEHPNVNSIIESFFETFKDEPLVIDKWFTVLATTPYANAQMIRKLMKHQAFNIKNPNRARSLIFGFCVNNMAQFHQEDGSGYELWRDCLLCIDAFNPQVAARLARSMDQWKRYKPILRNKAQNILKSIDINTLSRDTKEIVSKTLL